MTKMEKLFCVITDVFQFSKKSPGIGLSPAPDLEKVTHFILSKKMTDFLRTENLNSVFAAKSRGWWDSLWIPFPW